MDDKYSSIIYLKKSIFLLFNSKLYLQELAEDNCVIVIIGNKIDLCNDDEQRPVKYKDGAKLADVYLTILYKKKFIFISLQEYKCLFFESSARLGTSVIEIMEAIAR